MHNHAPQNYDCPICLAVAGVENDKTLITQNDIVYRDDRVMVFVASFFIGRNDGHLLVTPTQHFENMYDMPDEVGTRIFSVAREMSGIMTQAYGCTGVTTLQNNGPDAGQHAFHYHLHLFPRYKDDRIYDFMANKRSTTSEERASWVAKIKASL